MYKIVDTVKFSEVNSKGNLSFYALCDYMQNCTMLHIEELKKRIKCEELNHKVWMITSWEIVIKRIPRISERINVETEISSSKVFFQNRNFRTLDKNGEITTFTNSAWVYFNKKLNRVEKVPQYFLEIYSEKMQENVNYAWSKGNIIFEGIKEEKRGIQVLSSFIDINGHVNNAKLIMLAEGFIPKDFSVKKIRIEYRNQVFIKDTLYPWIYETYSKLTVAFTGKNKKIYVVVQFSKEW